MSFISKLLSIPSELIKSPSQFVSGIWQDGGRGQFLVLGMPAVIAFVLGVTALGLAYSNNSNLESRYESLAQKARDESERIFRSVRSDYPGQQITAIPEDDERRQEFLDELNKERIFLEKLIALNPEDPTPKYKLAQLASREGDFRRLESLLLVIAPFDEPGYADAHLLLAKLYLQRGRNRGSGDLDFERAKKQVRNALDVDTDNVDAKNLMAEIHVKERNFELAYILYKELFDDDPIYYRRLLELSGVANKSSERESILDQASRKFLQQIGKESDNDNVAAWVDAWRNYVLCMKLRGQYDTVRTALEKEIETYRDDIGKEVFLKRELSRVYCEQAMTLGRDATPANQRLQLSKLAKAIENDPKNIVALQWLTILGFSPEVGEDARKIYDPRYDQNAHANVLSEMGLQALNRKEIEDSILYFERARKKNPRDPQVLNNLAYAYLQSENKNPEQALLLVDQALTYIRNMGGSANNQQRQQFLSSFMDTRGTALMQLGRMEEAAAALEIAFRNRSDSTEIIQNLIKCYEATGNERQAEAYRRRLDVQLSKEQAAASGANQ